MPTSVEPFRSPLLSILCHVLQSTMVSVTAGLSHPVCACRLRTPQSPRCVRGPMYPLTAACVRQCSFSELELPQRRAEHFWTVNCAVSGTTPYPFDLHFIPPPNAAGYIFSLVILQCFRP
eukprot:EG_transcript_22593